MGSVIEKETWNHVCNKTFCILASNSAWERQFKILYRLCITPEVRHKMNPGLSDLCVTCKSDTGTFYYCMWSCPLIQQSWDLINLQLNSILKGPLWLRRNDLYTGSKCSDTPRLSEQRSSPHFALFCSEMYPPTLSRWQLTFSSITPLEAVFTAMMNKPILFFRFEILFLTIWEPPGLRLKVCLLEVFYWI